jgi:hypothetical protein
MSMPGRSCDCYEKCSQNRNALPKAQLPGSQFSLFYLVIDVIAAYNISCCEIKRCPGVVTFWKRSVFVREEIAL